MDIDMEMLDYIANYVIYIWFILVLIVTVYRLNNFIWDSITRYYNNKAEDRAIAKENNELLKMHLYSQVKKPIEENK